MRLFLKCYLCRICVVVYDLASFNTDDIFSYLNENIEVITVLVYIYGWESTFCDGYVCNCQTVPNSQLHCSMLAVQHNLTGKSGMADHNFFLASFWLFLQTGVEDSSYLPRYLLSREETNSWEHSDSSEYFVNAPTAVNKQLVFSVIPGKFHWSGVWPKVFVCSSIVWNQDLVLIQKIWIYFFQVKNKEMHSQLLLSDTNESIMRSI
jgi:hypothetical protein